MRKFYENPEIEIRKYDLTRSVFTASDPDLNDDDEYVLGSEGVNAAGFFGE